MIDYEGYFKHALLVRGPAGEIIHSIHTCDHAICRARREKEANMSAEVLEVCSVCKHTTRHRIDGNVATCIEHGTEASQKALTERSGFVRSDERLVGFLYILLRDHVPAGVLERLVAEEEQTRPPYQFSNGWLAQYAKDLAARLSR